jgi:hypothetical protein
MPFFLSSSPFINLLNLQGTSSTDGRACSNNYSSREEKGKLEAMIDTVTIPLLL